MDAKTYFLNIWRPRFRRRSHGPISFAEITDAMDRYRNFPGVPTCYELSVVQVGDITETVKLVRIGPAQKWRIERTIKSGETTSPEVYSFKYKQFIDLYWVKNNDDNNPPRNESDIYRDTWGAAYEEYLNAIKC
jgi:hypothetical protein